MVSVNFIRSSAMRRINSLLGAAFHGGAALGGFTKIFLCILVVIVGATLNSGVFSQIPLLDIFRLEKDHPAPVDFGSGPGAGIGPGRPNLVLGETPTIPKSSIVAAAPSGGGSGGFFGPAFPWPIIPIHVALLPGGSVLSYGTNQQGQQGAQFVYDVWNPKLGNGTNAHTILPNRTSTDIFCGAASLLGSGFTSGSNGSGNVLITGGDLTVNGRRNFSNDKVNIFNPNNTTLTASGGMNHPRWYPSITTLRNGDKLVLGGQFSPGVGEPTPEVRPATSPNSWRLLSGISISDNSTYWYYPRGFVGFDGAVYVLQHQNGKIYRLTTAGAGTKQDTLVQMVPGEIFYPSVMFSPFKVLTVRANHRVQVVDISRSPPVVTQIKPLNNSNRIWGNATLLPDGEVLVSGGAGGNNTLTNVAYQAEVFDPRSGTWTLGASASKPRLYHSSTLLLPDGSVLTGGGGAPGPVNELNAEIYYPAYLYAKDGSGNPAPRPRVVSAPSTLKLGQHFSVTVGTNDTVGQINLIRAGSNTHSFNSEQRLIPVPFSQTGTNITATLNASPELAPPGYYMLFVFNSSGVPAVANIISVLQAVQ
jgi:galactose oxidase-like protein